MPKGENLIGGEISRPTQFSAERQPDKYRQPDTITALIKRELASDGYMVTEAELLTDEGKPTGQKVQVRLKLTTMDAVAKKIIARAMKSSDRLMEHIWNRMEGKVPDTVNLGGQEGNPVNINTSSLSVAEKRNMLQMLKKAKRNANE
jgi:hypothetical protein